MAFFDQFSNLTPDQNQGLLAAAAQILQQSGPSRTPTSIGQILGGGLQAYQQGITEAEQRRLLRQQQQQQGQLLGLKIQDAQSDLANQAAARERAARLQRFYQDLGGSNPAAQIPEGQTANLSPTVANAQTIGTPSQNAAAANDLFSTRLAEAQALRRAGFGPEADAAETAALKFKEEYETKPQVGLDENGRPFQYLVGKGGSIKRLAGILPRDELKLADLGGRQVAYNPFALNPGQSFTKTATPGEQLTAGTAANRLAFDVGQANRPVFNAEAGGYVLPVNKANPTGGLLTVPGIQGKAPTEFQGKSAAFGLRADEANKLLNDLQGKYNPAAINSKLSVSEVPLLGGALGAATNKLALSPEDQQAEQAQRDFVNAVLRQESGAAIGAQEFDNARKQYFPQPGDSKEVIAQKARNRQLSVQALQANAGKAKLTAPMIPAANGVWSIQRVGE